MHSRTVQCLRCLVVWIVLLGVAGGAHAQLASKVKDINTTIPRSLGSPVMSELATLGSSTFFAFDDGGTGTELWKIDGATGSAALFKDICPGSCPSLPGGFVTLGGLLFFRADDGVHGYELWKTDGTVSGTAMVLEIYPGRRPSIAGLFTNFNGFLYFPADDGVHGAEMWRSDGTAAGTALVADFSPGPSTFFSGPASSHPGIQASSQDKFLFTVSDVAYGTEPWISNGTAAGTYRLRDLNPGPASSMRSAQAFPGYKPAMTLPDGTFLFAANDGVHGEELWRTDGTDAGTFLVKDINPGASDSDPSNFEVLNGKVYFVATHQDTGEELWVTDGTEAGTVLVKDLVAGTGSISPERLTVVNGRLFFRGTFQGFWTSDGTAAGTVLLTSTSMLALGKLGDSVLALTSPFSFGPLRLWKTDGTPAGTVELKNLGMPDSRCFFNQPDMRQIDEEVFFYRCLQGSGLELWKTDGTSAGTVLAQSPTRTPSFPGPIQSTSDVGFLAALGNGLFFSADDGASSQLWYTEGSPGSTQPVPGIPSANSWPSAGINRPFSFGNSLLYPHHTGLFRLDGSGAGSEPLVTPSFSSLSPAGDLLFFLRNTPANGEELWKSDGTAAGTSIVKDITPGSASTLIRLLQPLGSQYFFTVGTDVLWRSDGTEAGTLPLRDLLPVPGYSSSVDYSAVLGNTFFAISPDESFARTLWKSDGTPEGTVKVKVFEEGPPNFSGGVIRGMMPVGNRIYLRVDDGIHGDEVWVSDGTEAGTHLLKDVRPGPETGFLRWWTVPGQSLLYFIADDGTHGQEIWVSDGTVAGTRLLKDIWPGAGASFTESLSAPGQSPFYFFTAVDGTHGRELWVSDGTEAGTRLVKDIRPGVESSGISCCLVAVQNRYFFTADDGVHGIELWVSDGTEAGTRLVKDTLPGPESSLPSSLFSVGRTLVFNASDGVHGVEPWVTSGTETGTFMLQDVAPGAPSSSPWRYTSAPPHVYFIATDDAGTELWKTRKAALEPTFDDVHSTYWAWPYVEALATNGLTTGCGNGLYCPDRPVTRAEVAVFILRIVHGNTYVPPDVATTRFDDVPTGHWAVDWIEQLAAEGITSGCNVTPPFFCPESATARDQMAVFLLRALHGSSYTPPPATGTVFDDVPANYWAAAWIEQLAAEGITGGCQENLYCPGAPVSRDQMAVFLTRALNLALP